MTVYVYRPKHPEADGNGMVPLSIAGPKQVSNSAPSVISDTMAPLKHHGTGAIIDSKARFRADTKASGCVEIGTERIKPRQPIQLDKGSRREAIQKAIYQLKNGHIAFNPREG